MFKKTLTATVAALTLASATLTTTQSAQAGGLGNLIAVGIVGAAVGAVAAGSARSQEPSYRSDDRPYRGGYDGCGFRNRPVFDEYGRQVGVRQVSAC